MILYPDIRSQKLIFYKGEKMTYFKFIILTSVITLFLPFSSNAEKGIECISSEKKRIFSCEVLKLIDRFESKNFKTQEEFSYYLNAISEEILEDEFKNYDLKDIRGNAPVLIQTLFNFRAAIRKKALQWHEVAGLTQSLQHSTKRAISLTRYASDIIGELAQFQKSTDINVFEGGHPNTVTASTKGYQLKTGDVLLFRGQLHNSAAIARIGDTNALFSHAAIVYYNEKIRKFQLLESLIETGVVIQDLEEVLTHNIGRVTVLRYKGSEAIAERAAKLAYEKANSVIVNTGKPIPYDFTMLIKSENGKDPYDEMYCSEFVRFAYDKATNGDLLLPTYPSQINMKNDDFLKQVGVKAKWVFAPADMLLEPDFQIIADWSNYHKTSEIRLKDMMMDKIFEWMETRDLKFKKLFVASIIKFISQIPIFGNRIIGAVSEPIPSFLSESVISAMISLHLTATPIYKKLKAKNDFTLETTNFPLHPKKVYQYLDEILEESDGGFENFNNSSYPSKRLKKDFLPERR